MTIPSWQSLLSEEWEGITDQYGPHSNAVWSAIELLAKTPWLKNVGKPLDADDARGIEVVSSWDDALKLFDDPRFDEKGHVAAAVERVWPVTQASGYSAIWLKARQRAQDVYDYSGFIPKALPKETQDLLWEHLYTFISLLFAEIVGGDRVDCTLFREQFQWYQAGRFPCGWTGNWPQGNLRVF